jgi:hypothetical protein
MRDYETRRCHVCQGRYPPFRYRSAADVAEPDHLGLGHHWTEIDRMLTQRWTITVGHAQPALP